MTEYEVPATSIIPPEILLEGYCKGLFPMADSRTGALSWYTANPRGVLELDQFHVSRRLQRTIRQNRFEIRFDTAFVDVVAGCADRDERWISELIVRSYYLLHLEGYAHSAEAWQAGKLVGGVYGVALRGAFFGESMFHRASDAGKVALVALVDRLNRQGFRLFDTQMVTGGTLPFGAHLIPVREYKQRLKAALATDCVF